MPCASWLLARGLAPGQDSRPAHRRDRPGECGRRPPLRRPLRSAGERAALREPLDRAPRQPRATATATSTALDAATPARSASGAVATARIASATTPNGSDRGAHPSALEEDHLGEEEERRPASPASQATCSTPATAAPVGPLRAAGLLKRQPSSAITSADVFGSENIGKSWARAFSCSATEVAAVQSDRVMTL